MPETKVNWRSIKKDGYPSVEEFGTEPIVLVVLTVNEAKYRSLYTVRRVDNGQLKFIGIDHNPVWVKPHSLEPLENESWRVTHWITYLSEPEGE